MVRVLLLIGIGSGLGGVCRYLCQQFVQKHYPSSFPFGTLGVNILGCLVIGIVYGLANRGNLLSPEMRLFLATGICGGYTTFSSFAYENVSLVQDGELFYTLLYILLSVGTGLVAVYAGMLLIRLIH